MQCREGGWFSSVSFRDLRPDWSFVLHSICNILIKAKCCCLGAGHREGKLHHRAELTPEVYWGAGNERERATEESPGTELWKREGCMGGGPLFIREYSTAPGERL